MKLRKPRLPPPAKAYQNIPAGLRAFLLNDLALTLARERKGNPSKYGDEADRLFNQLYQRNVHGINLERDGHIDQAIAIYEANIADMYDGGYPYDRLRIIYTKRKQYDQALRVCCQFIKMADTFLELGCPRTDLPIKRQRFVIWYHKLEAKIQKT